MSLEYEAERLRDRRLAAARLRAENVTLAAEVERLKAEVAARDELEAWRLADPEQRRYVVDVSPAPRLMDWTVSVTLSEGRTGRLARGYDSDDSGDPTRPPYVAFAGHRCGVNAVIEAALARWRELYEGGVT